VGRRAPGGRAGIAGLRARAERRLRRPLPLLICIDVEPDERRVESADGAWSGFERLLDQLPKLRARVEDLTAGPAVLNWFVRADPQVADLHGDPGWAFKQYAPAWAALDREGDEIGIHAHAWRRGESGSWLVDHGDEAWVESCFAMAISAYRDKFGRPPACSRGGDRFMCERVIDTLERNGVIADATIEPRMPAAKGVGDDGPSTGSLPDYTAAKEVAYRPLRGDFLRSGQPARRLWMLPLTSGGPEVLYPWMDEYQFSKRLNERFTDGPCTHLAFAIRTDLTLDETAWERTQVNLERAAYIASVAGERRVQTRTASELAHALG
jgi:hypothetical protein